MMLKTLLAAAVASVEMGVPPGKAVRLTAGSTEILVSARAPKTVAFAARELQEMLGRVFDAPVPVVTAPTPGKASVVLGSNDWSVAAGIDTASLARDAFVIRADAANGRVYIAGRDDPGADIDLALAGKGDVARFEHATLFGVYQFLEDHADCRFFFPGEFGTVVPRRASLTVPAGTKTTEPVFTVRDPYMRYAPAAWPGETPDMADAARTAFRRRESSLAWMRLRLQTESIPCCHGQNGFFYQERFGKTHPEYFRLKEDGTRQTELDYEGNPLHWRVRHLCHTSKVWDEMYEDVKAYLTGKDASVRGIPSRWDKSKFGWNGNCQRGKVVDIMPQDGFMKCCCTNCQAAYTDDSNGCYASELIWGNTAKLANRLKAEGVKGCVTMMAYSPYGSVPTVDIPDNVRVMVARTGPWNIRNEKPLEKELADFRAWAEKTHGKVWIWTYPAKYGNTAIPDVPCMAPKTWGRYYQLAAPWIFGSFAECETDRAILNYLNYYVFAKIAWNPSLGLDALLDDHYEKMFGRGAAEMKRFYEEMEDAWLRVAGSLYWDELGPHGSVPSVYTQATDVYSPARLARWSGLCDKAAEKNAGDPAAQRRIAFIRREFVTKLADHFRGYMDSISVEKALARRATEPRRQNLVDPKGWSPYPAGIANPLVDETVTGPTGEKALHVRAVGNKAYLSGLLSRPGHRLKPRTTYRLSCFLKAKDVTPCHKSGGIYMEMNNGPKNWAESNKGTDRISGTTDWLYHEMTFRTSDTVDPKAHFTLYILLASGEVWYDGVRLEEMGE